MNFVHLHNHSHYSILEWLPKPKDYVKKAVELGMKAIAITDSWNVHGCHELYKACLDEWIKPILGAEVFVQSSLSNDLSHKLVLLAKNITGYKNIISIISKWSLDNPGRTPKVDIETLKEFASDIICLSGPISSEIAYYILSGKSDEDVVERIKLYQEIFWEDNYYLELLYHDDIPKQQFVTDKLIELHKEHGFQVVATNDCYYLSKDDKSTQDIIMALGTGHEVEDPDRKTLINGDYSLLNEEEMQTLFWFIPSALENTGKIADKIDIQIETGWLLLPRFELPEEHQGIYDTYLKLEQAEKGLKQLSSDEWYLRYLSFKWLNDRCGYDLDMDTIYEFTKKRTGKVLEKKLQITSPEELKEMSLTYYTDRKKEIISKMTDEQHEYIDRLEYELVVIHEMWFDGYFLIVADYINWARDNGVPVWPGRWSAAGSLMAYFSGITDLDPLQYGLLFERFLNPARISMPDIDTDFSDEWRDDVVDYCRRKYWEDHVAQICTFGTFAARAAVKDVWRVKGIHFQEMNQLAKLIPEKPGTKLQQALDEAPDFKAAYDENEIYKDIIDNALKIEGNVRQLWVHACAVIIAPAPMTNYTALSRPPKDENSIVTQYSANPLEDLGLLKMDFLWLRNLTIIKRALETIKITKGDDIDIWKIDFEDPKVFKIFGSWNTTWVFQFESDGMRKYLKDLQPNAFEDIIAMVSLYRPGPLQYIPTFIARKHGEEEVSYPHPDLEKILAPTSGIAIYQEQIMQMVQVFAGFSLGEADILRRAIWKKKIKLLMEQKEKFKIAAIEKWHPETLALEIFEDVIEPFAWYGFNKSHAACYAYIAYQTAYLKAYYPTEFLSAIMTSDEDNMERITLEVWECQILGIEVLPPDINESLKHFTYIDDDHIRFWLKAIKWLGNGPIQQIIEWRKKWKYTSLEDFIEKTGREVVGKKSLEALILSGSLDMFAKRKTLFDNIPEIIRYQRNLEKKEASSQIGLFDMGGWFEDKLKMKDTGNFSYEDKIFKEKEVMWFMVSGHPLDGLQRYCARRSANTKYLKMSFADIKVERDKDEKEFDKKLGKVKPKVVGVIMDVRKIVTKNGKNMMFVYCEWFDYDFEITIFDKNFAEYKDKAEIGKIVVADGRQSINLEYGRKSIYAEKILFASVTQVRAQAKDMNLFWNEKRPLLNVIQEEEPEVKEWEWTPESESVVVEQKAQEKKFEKDLEEKIEENKAQKEESISAPEKYVVSFPNNVAKELLLGFKKLLSTQEDGNIAIFIHILGKEVDTKVSVESLDSVKEWEDNNL